MSAYQFPAAAPSGPTAPSADPTAVIGRRIGGWVVDFLLYALIMAFLAPTPLSPLAEYYDDVPSSIDACEVLREDGDAVGCAAIGDRVYVTDGTDALIQFVVFVLIVLLYSALQGARGITPGKAIFGIKVVDEQGGYPGFGKSLARTLLWVVDLAPWCLPLVGFITGLSTKGHRRVGDMAAKTFVVGKGHTGPVAVPGMATAAAGGYPGAPGQPWGTPPAGAPGAPPPGWGGPPPAQQPGAWGAPAPGPQGPGGPPAGPTPAPDQRPAPPTGWTPPGTESPASSGGASDATPTPPAAEPPAAAPSGSRAEPPPTVEDPGAGPTPSADAPPDGGGAGEAPSAAASPPSGAATADSSPTPSAPAEGSSSDTAPDAGPSAASPAPDATGQPAATPPGSTPSRSSEGSAAAPSGYNPQWDAARGTYIVWEPNRGQWLGWDEAASEWKPL